jgi:hypothetical protein
VPVQNFQPPIRPGELPRVYRLALVWLVVAAIWVLAASRWILTDTIVPWDAKNQFYAFFRFLASALHAGHTPFWNPYHYGGHPSVADPQSLIFAPAFVLWALFDPTPTIRAFDLIVYAHLLVGGLAVGALGHRAGWPLSASLLAAAVFMFGGPASGRLQHTGIILSYGLFPLGLLLLLLALQRRSIALGTAFAVIAALIALGRNQEALLLCFVLFAAAVHECLRAERPLNYVRERLPVFAAVALTGALILTVPLLLTLQFALLSNRPEIPLEKALEASLYPANLATLAMPNVFGSLEGTLEYWGPNYDTLPEVGATDRSFNYLFVGATTTLLLLWFGAAGGWALRAPNRLMTAVLVVAGLYMLGRYTPVYALAFEYVPGISFFRRPIDGAFIFVAALSLIVGQLLADYVRQGLPRASLLAIATVAACALAIVAWAVVFSQRSHRAWSALFEAAKSLPIIVIAIALLGRSSSERARAVAAALVAALASGELLWWNAASSLNAEAPGYYSVLQEPTGADAQVMRILQREMDARHRLGERPRVEIVGVGGAWQNVAMARGLEATNGYNPLRIGSYDRLVSPGETTYLVDQRQFPPSFDGYDCALARELGLEYLVLGQPIERVPHLARRPVSEVLLAGPKAWVYRLRSAAPRVTFNTRVVVADANSALASGQLRVDLSPERALIDDDTAPAHQYRPMAAMPTSGRARIVSWRPDRIEVEVDADAPGILVLHDTYYPGWFAAVDGREAPILRANLLFRGVEVGEGRHSVVFRFAPFALRNLWDALRIALAGHARQVPGHSL